MPSERELEWLDYYIESGDAVAATKKVFHDLSESSIYVRNSQLKRKLANEIMVKTREKIGKDAPTMLAVIRDLALRGKTEAVRLSAAKDWLSRAGFDATTVIEHKQSETKEALVHKLGELVKGMDPAELKTLLGSDQVAATLLAALPIDVTPVADGVTVHQDRKSHINDH